MAQIDLLNKTILVTGCAGFIGSFLCKNLLSNFSEIKLVGIDSLTDYYDLSLKNDRLEMIRQVAEENKNRRNSYVFVKGDISDTDFIKKIFEDNKPSIVINLAAQAGVRYSITNPDSYIKSNIIGFYNILEACRASMSKEKPVEHLVYASSSSVYGSNKKVPYSIDDKVDNPVSLYAATKKSDELLAHAYSKLYNIPSTGLRFFTVYGPMGRPDMAYFKFTNKLVKGDPIQIYNMGDMYRDFTFIDDIVTGIVKVMQKSPEKNEDNVPYKIYNIGNNKPSSLMRFVEILENCLIQENIISAPGKKELLPMQPGDVYQTFADISDLEKDFDFKPMTSLEEGLEKFAKWYKTYY